MMGFLSNVHRYREAGEEANANNVERFGMPVKSLFTSTKLLSLHHHIDITDANENIVYQSESRILSLRDRTDVTDRRGELVAHVERKILSLHERHYVTMADGREFELTNELLHVINDITNIVGLGWQLRGNILGLNFELYDSNGDIIALISQKMLSLHDKYCIDIYKPEYEKEVVVILITLQHMMRDRANSSSAGSSSSSSSG
ncbi:MAG: LURP-one-related family protein [Lachnospiraceae bacterium]|jgi:uncharacterized protein YxjI|nr:LURP-one-related family protein [Lachnospiraceae bacterium]